MSSDDLQWEGPGSGGPGGASGGAVPEFLLDPMGVARRRWIPAVLCFGLGLVVTAVATALWVPTYIGTTNILLTSQQIPREFVRSTVEADSIANINAMLGEVLSVENLSGLIDEHGLFAKADPETQRIDLVNRMRGRIGASQQRSLSRRAEALVFEITYESQDRHEAALVANALADLFVEASINRRNSQAKRATTFLRSELERSEKQLEEISREVSEFRRKHRGELPDERSTILRKIDMLSAHRESLTQQIAAKEDRILSISSQRDTTALSEDEILLGELRRQLAREVAIHTDEHPNVVSLRDRITRLESAAAAGSGLSPNAERLVGAERREIGRMRDQRARIEAEIGDLDLRLDRIPVVEEDLVALQGKEQVLREDYVEALRKVQEAELAESLESAQQGGQVSILDPASPPSSPERPRSLIALGGLFASLMLGLGVAVLLELVDPVVIGLRQVERLGEAPVLGSVPYVA